MSGSRSSRIAGMSPALLSAIHRRMISTFSSDIARQYLARAGSSYSVTSDVRALARVAVVASDVAATVVYAANRLDPEIAVSDREVARERRRAARDIEAVVSCTPGRVALQETVAVLLAHPEPVHMAVFDQICADGIVCAA